LNVIDSTEYNGVDDNVYTCDLDDNGNLQYFRFIQSYFLLGNVGDRPVECDHKT